MPRRHALLIAAILLLSYVYVLPRWADWSQNSRLDLVRALSEQRSVIIDDYVANTGDYAFYQGHAYSDKAPGPVFLALPAALLIQPLLDLPLVRQPLERLAGGAALGTTLNPGGSGLADDKVRAFALQVALTIWTVALPTALAALALALLLRRVGVAERLVPVLVLAYGLATLIAPYGGNFYSHALVASLLVGAWAVASAAYSPWRALLIGLLLGWALISEYPAALPALAIGLAAAWGWRRPAALLWMTLGGLLPVLLMVVYDLRAFGTPLPVGYEYSALWQNQHQTGFVSLTYPQPAALWGLTFGLYRGLFVRAPWLLLALPGYVLWWRSRQHRPLWWVALLAPLSMLLFYGSSAMWWGGFAAGPRYLVPLVPFLALASAWAAAALWRGAWGRAGLLALIGLSVVLTWGEALARQSFPLDTIANPWIGYTLPAWVEGDLARNLGMALGLRGLASLLPLALLIAGAFVYSLRRSPTAAAAVQAPIVEGQTVASIQH
jgi:hypothetical protein